MRTKHPGASMSAPVQVCAVQRALEDAAGSMLSGDSYRRRHAAAWRLPRGTECSIKATMIGLAQYADTYRQTYDPGIGADYVLGDYWYASLQGLMRLRDGDIGRFDAGLLGEQGAAMCAAAGFVGIVEPSCAQDEQ